MVLEVVNLRHRVIPIRREEGEMRDGTRRGRPVRTFVALNRRHTGGARQGEGLVWKSTGVDEIDWEKVGGKRRGAYGRVRYGV